jgi:hypothetical protein
VTLVAAVHCFGYPFLIGDHMLTEVRTKTGSAGRKLIRLRPSLMLGWSGCNEDAANVFVELMAYLTNSPDRNELQAALRFYGPLLKKRLHLAGWVHESGRWHAIRWSGPMT